MSLDSWKSGLVQTPTEYFKTSLVETTKTYQYIFCEGYGGTIIAGCHIDCSETRHAYSSQTYSYMT